VFSSDTNAFLDLSILLTRYFFKPVPADGFSIGLIEIVKFSPLNEPLIVSVSPTPLKVLDLGSYETLVKSILLSKNKTERISSFF